MTKTNTSKPKDKLREELLKAIDYETDWASVDYYAPKDYGSQYEEELGRGKILELFNLALKQQREEIDKGWVDYFQHKDDMREAGRKAADEYLKSRNKHDK